MLNLGVGPTVKVEKNGQELTIKIPTLTVKDDVLAGSLAVGNAVRPQETPDVLKLLDFTDEHSSALKEAYSGNPTVAALAVGQEFVARNNAKTYSQEQVDALSGPLKECHTTLKAQNLAFGEDFRVRANAKPSLAIMEKVDAISAEIKKPFWEQAVEKAQEFANRAANHVRAFIRTPQNSSAPKRGNGGLAPLRGM